MAAVNLKPSWTVALLTVPLSVTLAACGSAGGGNNPHPSKAAEVTTQPAPSCNVYLYGDDARVTVSASGGAKPDAECGQLAKTLSGGGDFWTAQTITARQSLSVVCALKHDPWTVVIRDSGYQVYGQGVCTTLIGYGWTEDTDAETAAQEQDAKAAQDRAKAKARQDDLTGAQSDLSALQDSLKSFTNARALRTDAKATGSDLANERRDAANGVGDQCTNVDTTVYNDAATTVYNDVLTTVYDDAADEQKGLDQLRDRIKAVQHDEATLKADGLDPLDGASSAVKTGQGDVTKAVKTANAAINEANADLVTAYRVANALATGECAGDGPGDAPTGVSHVS